MNQWRLDSDVLLGSTLEVMTEQVPEMVEVQLVMPEWQAMKECEGNLSLVGGWGVDVEYCWWVVNLVIRLEVMMSEKKFLSVVRMQCVRSEELGKYHFLQAL